MSITIYKTEVSLIRRMTEECNLHGGLNLGQGLCPLHPPSSLIRAAQAAVETGHNSYGPAQGVPELRRSLATKLKAYNGIDADSDAEIMVTSGATGGYVAALHAVCTPGDTIILAEPFYGYHRLLAEQAGLRIAPVELTSGGPAALQLQLQARTDLVSAKAIVICNPSNPSGRVLCREEIQVMLDWADAHGVCIITDETYEYFLYDGCRHVSPASLASRDSRVISIFSFSKTFSVPGWRLGYAVAPATLLPRMITVHDRLYICPPKPFQQAGLAALQLDGSYYAELRTEFEDRRHVLMTALSHTPLRPTTPAGAYYLWADATALGCATSYDSSMHILKQAGVASVPGSAFYVSESGEGWVRFCFAVSRADLDQAAKQLASRLGRAK